MGSQLAGEEGCLIVPPFSLPRSVQRHRHNDVNPVIGSDKRVPALSHQLAQERRQGSQILILEAMHGLAQGAAMEGKGQEPI
jgi:hypothetical protein